VRWRAITLATGFGRRYGPRVLDRLRRLVGITPQQLQSMRKFMVRWGSWGVFVARFIPGLRFLAGPLAGTVGLHFTAFIAANVLSEPSCTCR
jgi:membrane protein DedA with SNARE-associated domain